MRERRRAPTPRRRGAGRLGPAALRAHRRFGRPPARRLSARGGPEEVGVGGGGPRVYRSIASRTEHLTKGCQVRVRPTEFRERREAGEELKRL